MPSPPKTEIERSQKGKKQGGRSTCPSRDAEAFEHINDAGAAGVGQTNEGERTAQFVTQERSSSVRLDVIEDHGSFITRQSVRIDGATVGKTQMETSYIE